MKNKKFTKDDLKVGYIVVCDEGTYMVNMVMRGERENLIAVDQECKWIDLKDDLTHDLICPSQGDLTITSVYGYCTFGFKSCAISTDDRPLLWKREEPAKKMTVEEIEKELGYKVEIVS